MGDGHAQLFAENRELRRRVAILRAVVGVLVALLRLAKTRFDFERIPESDSKRALLRAIKRSKKRAPLHAVIDNYSRRILSWTLEARLGSGATCRILRETAKQIVCNVGSSLVVTDAGSENVNRDVDVELDDSNLQRVLAQIDVTYSNSMIEAFWRSLKHSWLHLHGLESESEGRSNQSLLSVEPRLRFLEWVETASLGVGCARGMDEVVFPVLQLRRSKC